MFADPMATHTFVMDSDASLVRAVNLAAVDNSQPRRTTTAFQQYRSIVQSVTSSMVNMATHGKTKVKKMIQFRFRLVSTHLEMTRLTL